MSREDQIAKICRLLEDCAGLRPGSVGPTTSINRELGFDGEDLFEVIQSASDLLGSKPNPPFDFNLFNSERSPLAVALFAPLSKVMTTLMPDRYGRPISPTAPVESLTPERLRDILVSSPPSAAG